MNNDFFYYLMNNNYNNYKNDVFFDSETIKKIGILFAAGCVMGVLLAVMFAGFLYGIQQKTDEERLSYGKLVIIIIAPSILLGLIAGILLL